jgi:tetratricopeptide (TPR) repeat protein
MMTDAPTTPDPIEIAMEAQASGRAPHGVAHEVLRRQSVLIGWQIASERAGAAVRILTGAAIAGALAASGFFLWSASRAEGVVIGAFETPPGLAQHGITGSVVAAQVLDRLRAMQAETLTLRAEASLGSGWGGSVRVAIPNTGVSLGELRQYLVDWLGRETRVSGEVFEGPDGQLSVATRVGVRPGTTSTGAPAELPGLLTQAAEAIYSQTQPYLYSRWLAQHDRKAEAEAILQRVLADPDGAERLWALYSLVGEAATTAEKWRYIQAARGLDPGFTPILHATAVTLHAEGREQAARDAYRAVIAHAAQMRRQVNAQEADTRLTIDRAFEASYELDYPATARWSHAVIGTHGQTGGKDENALYTARNLTFAHDLAGARAALAEAGVDETELDARLVRAGVNADPRRFRARALGDWAQAADDLAAIDTPVNEPVVRVEHALALARAGRTAEALAAVDALPRTATARAYGRAFALSIQGRGAEADGWFAEAVREGPELPLPHLLWAEALLRRGDAGGALREVETAQRLGPRAPDIWKLKGDILMRLGRAAEAGDAYASAARLEPNWGGLRLAWGDALAKAGKTERARVQWRTAAALDLSAADRAEITRSLR